MGFQVGWPHLSKACVVPLGDTSPQGGRFVPHPGGLGVVCLLWCAGMPCFSNGILLGQETIVVGQPGAQHPLPVSPSLWFIHGTSAWCVCV